MKKLALTIAIVLGLGMASFADNGGLFNRGASAPASSTSSSSYEGNRDGIFAPRIPNHGETTHQNAPVGSGIAVLTALGAAYLVGKKRREE